MSRLTRRALLVGTASFTALACGGRAPRATGSAPEAEPAPAPRQKARSAEGAGEPGSLFRVDQTLPPAGTRWDDAPAWYRRAPGLWCPNTRSAGSVLLTFTPRGATDDDLCRRITHFRELPKLLESARRLGTDVVYLVDWYDGPAGAPCGDYWRHKGNYLPRADLGGREAFVDGVRAVKEAGGHVILYVEPFIFEKETEIGRQKGLAWSIKTADGGTPEEPYPTAWKLCPENPAMVAHFVEVAGRVVGDYGASGLFLDSYGNQRGWKCHDPDHGHPPGDGEVFDAGVRKLVRAMRDAARARDPKAVLMCEGAKLPMLPTWLGGSLDWGIHELSKRWAWREAGHTSIFSAGWSLDDVHQILALGHKLALGGDWWFGAPEGRAADAIAKRTAKIPELKDDRFRRFFAEECFRDLHRFRNAGLLLGRGMPNIDEVTPRRWDKNPTFQTDQGLLAVLDQCRGAAERIDLALAGAGATLPSPEAHVKALMDARGRFDRVLQDAEVRVLEPPSPDAAAYLFEGPKGRGVTCVNVSGRPLETALRVGEGAFEDLLDGGTQQATGGLRVAVPPHAVRFWATA